jgi:hypothetical protein
MELIDNSQTNDGLKDLPYRETVYRILIATWQAMKVTLWLYYFMMLEWITRSPDDKEKLSAPGIGLS